MALMTRGEAATQVSAVCTDALRAIAEGDYMLARDFLTVALGQTAAIVATPLKRRKVVEIGKSPRTSSSLVIGVGILECFDGSAMLGVADVADKLEVSRSTVHRYMTTLVLLGYLEQPAGAKRKYRRPQIEPTATAA